MYDAVATMDTITLIRSAVRGLLTAAGADLAAALRTALTSGDDYNSTAKPVVDWDDKTAREALIDSRAHDGYALLTALDGREALPESGPATTASTATKATSPSTRTARSSPASRSPRATPATPNPPPS